MSVYEMNKLLYRTEKDEDFRRRIQTEPDRVLLEVSLSEEERVLAEWGFPFRAASSRSS